jgi:RNA polymerase sigma factor (sigma-70 family)
MVGLEELTDEALVHRISSSAPAPDAKAEAELCRRYGRRVRLYGVRHLRDHDKAEDLAQQALLILLEGVRAGRLEAADRIGAFLFGICRNLALAMRRGERRAERSYPPHDTGERFDTVDRMRLANCFDGLAAREQRLLTMSFHDGQPIDEIAGALGLSAVNARVIRHRAILSLRACMEGQ